MGGFSVQKDVMVPMRDGVCLATDLYLPEPQAGGATAWPTLLTRTPYDKDAVAAQPPADPQMFRPGNAAFASAFAARGYVVAVQTVRGRYKSEGGWQMLTDDANDAVDTCSWIGRQAWSDGQVGMFGTSYPGGLQHIAAFAHAPELKTVIPVDAVSNMGRKSV